MCDALHKTHCEAVKVHSHGPRRPVHCGGSRPTPVSVRECTIVCKGGSCPAPSCPERQSPAAVPAKSARWGATDRAQANMHTNTHTYTHPHACGHLCRHIMRCAPSVNAHRLHLPHAVHAQCVNCRGTTIKPAARRTLAACRAQLRPHPQSLGGLQHL